MALTPSTMPELGMECPEFALPDAVTGRTVTRDEHGGAGLLVMFICNHCPYVVHVRDELTRVAAEYSAKGIDVIAVNSNSERTHPQDGPPHMKSLAEELGWDFPFVFDASQDVARAFGAACTPDLFLFDGARRLFYRGQLDDSRPGGAPADGRDLRAALDALLDGDDPPQPQHPSIGCNIKWDG